MMLDVDSVMAAVSRVIDDDEKKKHNSPSERIFTAACFKTGSDRDVFVGAANGEVSAYAHRSSHIE